MKIFSWASALKQIPLTWVSTTRNIDLSGPLRGLVASQPQPGPVVVLSKAPQPIQKYKLSMARPTMLFTQSYISHLLLTEGRRRSTCNDPSSYFIKTINKTRSGDTGAVVPAPISATQVCLGQLHETLSQKNKIKQNIRSFLKQTKPTITTTTNNNNTNNSSNSNRNSYS